MSEQPAASARSDEPVDRLSELFESHGERLYRVARRLVSSADDALDLVQEAFLKAARSPASIPSGATAEEAWLVRVLINIRRDQWRKEAVRKRHDLEVAHTTSRHIHPETAFLARTTVWQALDYLPPRRRAVVVMYEIDGLSMASIASVLGINAITVRWHLSRGRRELARRLKCESGELDEHAQDSVAGRRPTAPRTLAP